MVVHGNRGKCAQPCRLPYELIKKEYESENTETLDKGYLLSPRDLCSLDLLPTLVDLGVTCFKIEGRLKNPEYVSTVTRIYRKYIDLAQSDKPYIIEEADRKDLLQVFNRGGFSTGYLAPEPNSNLIYKNKSNNMGIPLGTVSNFNSNKGYITLKLQDELSIGDTVSLEKETGTYTISELMINKHNTPSAKKGDIVKIGRIKGKISVNDRIFKMSSKRLNTITNDYLNNENIKIKINCKITIHHNTPVAMRIFTDDIDTVNSSSNSVLSSNANSSPLYKNLDFTITSDLIPVNAINSPITKERIIDQINKLGGTPFEFANIDVDLDDNLYIPSISQLNQLRRDCVSKLEEILLDRIHRKCDINYQDYNNNTIKNNINKSISILLNILKTDFEYSKLKNVDRIYIPLKYFYMPQFASKILEITNIVDTYIYMPSIMKDSVIKQVCKSLDKILTTYSIKGFVISNISQIHLLQDYTNDYELISNYTMNVYNNYTIQELENLHISCITLSPELDKSTLSSITSKAKTEAIVYGNTPVMTTNYCLLSKSNNCLQKCNYNCSNQNQEYYLKDRLNMNFRIIPDSFSKTTTIFNSKKTSIYSNDLNVDCIRLDFIDEDIKDICEIVKIFKNGEFLEGTEYTNGNFNRIV